MIAIVPIIAAILSALLYVLAANPKAAELGRLTFGASILVVLLTLAGRTVHLF